MGRRPAADVGPLTWIECATGDEVVAAVDGGGIDLCILDGEAQPTGGLALARQLEEEVADRPAVVRPHRPAGRPLAGPLVARRGHAAAAGRPADRARRGRGAAARARAAPRRPPVTGPPARPPRPDLAGPAQPAAGRAGPHRRRHRLGDARGDDRRGHAPPRSRPSRSRCGPRGSRPRRSPAWPPRCSPRRRRCELPLDCVDIVGTGGDGAHTVNISTMAAVVTAAAGAPVAKHGGRAASSSSGAADVLEALGVAIDLPAAGVARCVQEAGIGFFFAPVFHPGMRHAGGPRREMGIAHGLQLPRPADQPGAAGGRGDRLRRPPDGAGDGRGAGRPRWPGAGLPRRRRSGRADHRHDVVGVGRPRRRGRRPTGSTRRRWASRRPARTRCAAARRRSTPTSSAGCSPASRGRCATPCC